jgi:manganese oxidase
MRAASRSWSPPRAVRNEQVDSPAWLLVLAAALAYGGGAWMLFLRFTQSGLGANQPPLALQWLRDSSVSLPITGLVVFGAAALSTRLAQRQGFTQRALLAITAAIGGAVALGVGNVATERVFGASGLPGVHELPLALAVARDATLALAATLPVTATVLAGIGAFASLRAAMSRRERGVSGLRRFVARVVAGSVVAGSLAMMPLTTSSASADVADPGAPCPAGADQRSFDVTAVDVKIPLNRFGDNDPKGKMFVATSTTYNGVTVENMLTSPGGAAKPALQAVRAEEASQKVSIGLRDDPIQPLSIRANEGDCVTINFTNSASGGDYGLHIDGLMFTTSSSGDGIGRNDESSVASGGTTTYRYYIPKDRNLEGSHYVHPGPGYRSQVDHGLFGMLNVEPPNSTYLNASNIGQELVSGWEAIIAPGTKPAFREAILMHHEVGSDNEKVYDKNNSALPQVDSTTGSYTPGHFALNYRSEPFRNRLLAFAKEKSHSYSSYTFGDPATPMPRGYIGDPTKFRISHASGEKFHVYHLHGGGDRWRLNPVADPSWNYADTRLNKHPQNEVASNRLDAQSIGPGESYNLELEGGAGGVQHSVGDLLFHCHIAKHYVSGMWSFWRVYNTLQPDFAPLPDLAAPPTPVTSDQLMGKTFDNGQKITTHADLDSWVRQQVPPQGVKATAQDPSVWDWKFNNTTGGNADRALGEPEDTTAWADMSDVPGHPGLLPGDQLDKIAGGRPAILFNPVDGRPSYPLLRTHFGQRPPFSPQGHSGSPFLGVLGDAAPHIDATHPVDPYANRPDGLCPSKQSDGVNDTPIKHFNIVAIEKSIQRSVKPGGKGGGVVDPEGKLFVLAQDKDAMYAGNRPTDPLALRVNVGDCAKVTLTNEMTDVGAFDGNSKTTIHIHHVQFDVQGSDGVSTGFAYEHSVRPYKVEDPTLTSAAAAGDTVLHLSSVAKFQDKTADGTAAQPFIGTGMGTESIEEHQVIAVDPANLTVTLDAPLVNAHPTGQYAGFEFIQYEWYADTQLDNIFWHDHVDGIHGWGHGLVGQLIVEPAGSKYTDPSTGQPIASGTIADIRVDPKAPNYQSLLPGKVNGSFRELALWTIDDNDKGDYSTLNLKAAPFKDRPDPANRFSSFKYGDPTTPLPRAYPGDPVVVRTINVGPSLDTLRFTGQRFTIDNRMSYDASGKTQGDPGSGSGTSMGTLQDTIHYGMSEKYTLALEGNGPNGRSKPGDYLYYNGTGRRFADGAWGIIRVLNGSTPTLQPLPGTSAPANPATIPASLPVVTNPSNPCPSGAPIHAFKISAVDTPAAAQSVFTDSANAAAVQAGTLAPEPLVMHVAEGECVKVSLTNARSAPVSFAVGKLDRNVDSSGVNVGYGPDNNTAPGATRDYIYYADTHYIGSATVADMAGLTGDGGVLTTDTQKKGLYGSIVVAEKGATFTNSKTGAPVDIGTQVDVDVPAYGNTARHAYRDFSLLMADDDARMSQDFMPYPDVTNGLANINYQTAPKGDDASVFHTGSNDPATPVLTAYIGDPMVVHEMVTPGSEQAHVFSLGGWSAPRDRWVPHSELTTNQALAPGETFDAEMLEGAGAGKNWATGDYFYGDLRRPFTQAGVWGLQRFMARPADCANVGAGNPACLFEAPAAPATPEPSVTSTPKSVDPSPTGAKPATAPSAPTLKTAAAGVRAVTASWSAPSNDGGSPVTGYTVTATNKASGVATRMKVAASARSATVTGLANKTGYQMTVAATNAAGTGPSSSASAVVTTAKAAGASLIGHAVKGVRRDSVVSATATWSAPKVTGGAPTTGYLVTAYRFKGTKLVGKKTWASTVSPSTTRLRFRGLVSGASYRFKVRVVNPAGTSAFSAFSNRVTAR